MSSEEEEEEEQTDPEVSLKSIFKIKLGLNLE